MHMLSVRMSYSLFSSLNQPTDLPPQPQLSTCKYPHARTGFPRHLTRLRSAAGPQFVQALGEYMDNLAPSNICPRAINSSILHPIRKLPHVAFCINGRTVHDDVHIYDLITGALISWDTAKQLGILPQCYPEPARQIDAIHAGHHASNPLQLLTRSWKNFLQCSMDKFVQCQGSSSTSLDKGCLSFLCDHPS